MTAGAKFQQFNCQTANRHCERSEAIHRTAQRKNGLLRRFAPRNDGQMHARDLAACFRASFAFSPAPIKGRRECRALGAPAALCAKVKKHTSIVTTVTPETPGIPRAMVLTAYIALSPVTGLSCHRRPQEACFSRT
jgi:hypothetical protein